MASELFSVAVWTLVVFGAGYGFRIERERAKEGRR